MSADWMRPANEAEIPSPALLMYPERVDENLRRMVALAGSPERLRPHIKTHKLPQIVRRQVALGISKVKCATVAEAEMAAEAGATDVLLAAQLVGPHVSRWLGLTAAFSQCQFQSLVDDLETASILSAAARARGQKVGILLDLDVGQHRTGIAPGARAVELYERVSKMPGLVAGGLHAYDGHLHQTDVQERSRAADEVADWVGGLRSELLGRGLSVPRVVMGGTPTFPMHARREGIECSPGTCVLWDAGYASKVPDLDFLVAAVLLTRVVSRPATNRLCLDLGHKAVASEMPHPRVVFPALPDARAVAHNEEHLVLETSQAGDFKVGSTLLGIPWHICPTVALHSTVSVVEQGRVTAEWPVVARQRQLRF